jgi:hypothetical protein
MRWWQFCLWLLPLWFGLAQARAQEPGPAEPAEYRETVDEAVREFAARNFDESRVLFARAHQLFPNARTERGLGLAAFELRDYNECILRLEAALASEVKPLDAQLRTDTEQMLARANQFVGRVVIRALPAHARVSVDGSAAAATKEKPLVLKVGEHTLEAQAAGFLAERRPFRVESGALQTLEVVLKVVPPAQEPVEPEKRHWYKNPWLWGTVGAVLVGAVAGTGVALRNSSRDHADSYGGTTKTVIIGPPAGTR